MKKYAKPLLQLAKNLRKEMTRQERRLWYEYLRFYPVKFRRQVPVDNYILDFYCHQAGLAIELDGSQHFEPEGEQRDERRSARLAELGINVVRYNNLQVDRHFAIVCEEIDRIVKERLAELSEG